MKFKKLNESTELYSGIFWIKDLENIYNNEDLCFLIPSDSYGNVDTTLDLNAKSGLTYNHERVWNNLPKTLTDGKSFDYYPRGRVQINHGTAIIYLNPNINTEKVQEFIKNTYHLIPYNGINKIRFISDGSEHYKCYLDV